MADDACMGTPDGRRGIDSGAAVHAIQPEPERRWVLEDGGTPVPPLHNDGLVDEFGALIVVDADGDRCYLSE